MWPIVLSLADRHGVVDVTPDYLSRVTGLPVDEVTACMKRFCAPDPYSRSGAEGGARLILVDEHRDWGWRIVNHGIYREKARKQMQQIHATESGRDAERKRVDRERKAAGRVQPCPASPALSGAVRPSDSDSDPDKTKNSEGAGAPDSRLSSEFENRAFHDSVVAAYHHHCPELPRVKAWTPKRRAALNARIRERLKDGKPADTVEYWRSVFSTVASSDFLMGRKTDFRADLEWLLRPENFLKLIEGRYTNNGKGSRPSGGEIVDGR
jgi:hypothetical protein